jgi:indole-3-glycerol phosphate synthase
VIKQYAIEAKALGMEVLLEVHDEKEVQDNLDSGADLVGVNNRSLKTFEVSIETSKRLSEIIPNQFVKISESGIDKPTAIHELKQYGYNGFLIGETFMKHSRPEKACKEFIDELIVM